MRKCRRRPGTWPQRLSNRYGDPVQVTRIGSSARARQAATLAIGAARFRRKPAAGLPSADSTPTARRSHTLQSAAAQRFPDMMQAVREESMSTLV
jgi:hypothetical protein